MTGAELHDFELLGCASNTVEGRAICKLVSEVKSLQHELNDPNYQYVGRIHRHAIISRDCEITKLREEIKQLKGDKS